MMTVVDPSGTPSLIYNRGGTTLDSITAVGSSQATAAQIVRYSGYTIVNVDNGVGVGGVVLPADAEVGDVVEIHLTSNGVSISVYPESGGNINAQGENNPQPVTHALVRRTASGQWFALYVRE